MLEKVKSVSLSYVGNPGFGIRCHPLDSANPGFVWRVPLANPLKSLDSRTGIYKMGQKESRFRIFFLAAQNARGLTRPGAKKNPKS